jgi:hypothetical protein
LLRGRGTGNDAREGTLSRLGEMLVRKVLAGVVYAPACPLCSSLGLVVFRIGHQWVLSEDAHSSIIRDNRRLLDSYQTVMYKVSGGQARGLEKGR